MKRLLLVLVIALSAFGIMSARDRYSTDPKVLPEVARTMIAKHFPKTTVHHIKIDKPLLGSTDYDVVLSDGTEIEFDADGAWTEIDCGRRAVPKELVLTSIQNYVTKHWPNQTVSQIKVERNKYEVELSNGVDIEFDRTGNFLRLDD